jgi:hypothetical protein
VVLADVAAAALLADAPKTALLADSAAASLLADAPDVVMRADATAAAPFADAAAALMLEECADIHDAGTLFGGRKKGVV